MNARCLFISFLLALAPACLRAQLPDTLFLHFPAADYPVLADGLPEAGYSETLPANRQYGGAEDFNVSVEYPEFQSLTDAEVKCLVKQGAQLPDRIVPEVNLGMVRRQPRLDVVFCPIVRRNGQYQRLVSCKIVVSEKASRPRRVAAAAPAERYAAHSVLSKGKWVKISVAKEGMYALTASQLKDMGFGDINRVKLYGYGGRIQPELLDFTSDDAVIDDLNEMPLHRSANGVLFYADGTVRWSYSSSTMRYTHTDNYYSSLSYYFLTEGDQPLSLSETEGEQADQTIATVPGHALYDGNSFMWYEGGRRLFDSYDFASGRQHTFRLDSPGFDGESKAKAVLEISMSASSPLSKTPYTVTVNGKADTTPRSVPLYGDNESARVSSSTLQPDNLAATNSVQITTGNDNHARLDYMRLTYPRRLSGSDQPFSFVTGEKQAVNVSIANADAGTQVWELPHGTTPLRRVKATLSGTTLTTSALQPGVRYALVNVGRGYEAPALIGQVENQDLHADGPADMVVVIPASGKLPAQAERLARLHKEHDGLRVRVVSAGKIYNEFSSGTPDANAIRRYLKMLYDRAEAEADMPRYLLLFGNGLADNRMLTSAHKSKSPDDYLLCFEMDNSVGAVGDNYSYVSDDLFGLLDDGEGGNITKEKIDLGIGRFCCTDEAEAKVLVDKVVQYLGNADAGIWKNDLLLMGDYGDNNDHMKDAERVAAEVSAIAPHVNLIKVYPDAYTWQTAATGHTFPQASKRVQEKIAEGVAVVNYSGHGAPNQLSHAWLTSTDALRNVATTRLPLWLLASCEIFPIDQEEENIGRMSMLKPDGGSIAFICATRAVYAQYNNPLNCHVSRYLYALSPEGRRYTFGEALMLGKADVLKADATMNKLKYVLIGDPALSLSTPNGRVVIDSIGGRSVGGNVQLKAGSVVRLSGHIEGEPDYGGLLSLRIYDHEQTITCKDNAKDSKDSQNGAYKYQALGNCVFSATSPVEKGRFSTTVSIPLDISYTDRPARISLYAVDSLYRREATGLFTRVSLNGTDTLASSDSLPPSAFLYVGEPDFPDGGSVPADFVLEAHIADNYGINAAGSGLGHEMSLTIDGDAERAINLGDYFTYDFGTHLSGHVAYPLSGLSAGLHSLALRVWDISNNTTLARLDVVVSDSPASGSFAVSSSCNPVVASTQLIVTLPQGHGGEPVILRIYNTQGQTVWERECPVSEDQHFASAAWDARTTAGTPLPMGIYLLRAEQGNQHTKTKKLLVQKQ
ncbi:MAG: type IX secretion system sortase PorU [Bacteroidaceae bacterium]|nr:type IX secretion system sortase PorU [Bacteroidaceae bacterium]